MVQRLQGKLIMSFLSNYNYKTQRKMCYPSLGDQLDDLYKQGAFSAEMAEKIKKVKDDIPKS